MTQVGTWAIPHQGLDLDLLVQEKQLILAAPIDSWPGMRLTTEPIREELETWAIQIGYHPVWYLTAWVYQAEEACRT